MSSVSPLEFSSLSSLLRTTSTAFHQQLPCLLLSQPGPKTFRSYLSSVHHLGSRKPFTVAAGTTLTTNTVPARNDIYTVGDFMTRKEELHVVKPTTTADEALEALVENRITGFTVIDDDWKLCMLNGIIRQTLMVFNGIKKFFLAAGTARSDVAIFPEVDSTWKAFNEVQKLLSKTNGQVVGDLMTPAPLVVRKSTNLEDAARLLLKTKYRRLPVVDANGRLVGIITRGNVVRAALQIKQEIEKKP